MTKQPPQVVVITDRHDAHVDFVEKHLSVPLVIIDPQTLLERAELSFRLQGAHSVITYDGKRLDAVTSVWYRKPVEVSGSQVPVAKELKPYVITSLQRHSLMLVSAFETALWVNEYFAMHRAESKAWQLEQARRVGLQVPSTVITSDPEVATAFIKAQGTCLVKPHSAYSPSVAGLQKGFLTTKISKDAMPDLSRLYLAPAIFQQAIDAVCDVRVTVIGDAVFAAKITNPSLDQDSPVRDWRIGHYLGDMQIEPFDNFPKALARKCVALVKSLGLVFGAIDLVMDAAGELWFLENNPNGQWAFIEKLTGQPLGRAMANLLQTGNTKIA